MNHIYIITLTSLCLAAILAVIILFLLNRKLRRDLVYECDNHLETIHVLYELRDNYSAALQLKNQILIEWDIEKDILHFTADFIRLTKYDYPELQNTFRFYCSIIHPDDASSFRERASDFRKNISQCLDDTHRIRKKSGEYCWINFRVAGNTENNMVLGTLTEITNIKNKELEQKERIYYLEKSLHDMRGEYARRFDGINSEVLMNYVQYANTISHFLVSSSGEENTQEKTIKRKNSQTTIELTDHTSSNLLKDLIWMIDIDSGRYQPEIQLIDIQKQLREIQNTIANKKDNYGRERIALIFNLAENQNTKANFDPKLFHKIIYSFANNAVEATFNGYVEINYSFDERMNNHLFKISDTGSVILVNNSISLIENVMSRSYRYFPSKESEFYIILAIKMVRLLQGKITFEKQENLNIVCISLPNV